MRSLIAFVGFKASGKNTAAEALYPHSFIPLSFADSLKDALAAIFCWDRDLLEGITVESRAWRERVDPWWAAKLDIPQFSPRWAMMHIGTDVMRRYFNYDLWVHNVERRILLAGEAPIVLIDSRFPNEIALAHRYGGRVIRIKRGADPAWTELAELANLHWSDVVRDHALAQLQELGIHPSEFAWIGSPIDDTISNDGTIADLHAVVSERLISV